MFRESVSGDELSVGMKIPFVEYAFLNTIAELALAQCPDVRHLPPESGRWHSLLHQDIFELPRIRCVDVFWEEAGSPCERRPICVESINRTEIRQLEF